MDDGQIEDLCRSAAITTTAPVANASELAARLRQARALLSRLPLPERLPAVLVLGPRQPPRWVVLAGDSVSVGREASNDLVVDDESVSRQHCRLFVEGNSWQVEDRGSRHGVGLRGAKIARLALCSGDVLSLGSACLLFVDEAPAEEAAPRE
jgi:hypothetical protein